MTGLQRQWQRLSLFDEFGIMTAVAETVPANSVVLTDYLTAVALQFYFSAN
jgi:hypothetical protein